MSFLAEIDTVPGLDLVCANYFDPSTMYSGNPGSLLDRNPIWSSGSHNYGSRAVAVGDIDGDTFLDVVFANEDSPNTVHRNEQGRFLETSPSWESDEAEGTFCVALGAVACVRWEEWTLVGWKPDALHGGILLYPRGRSPKELQWRAGGVLLSLVTDLLLIPVAALVL